jgi:hypothetical protein
VSLARRLGDGKVLGGAVGPPGQVAALRVWRARVLVNYGSKIDHFVFFLHWEEAPIML